MRYSPNAIESKWQKRWLRERTYEPDLRRAKRPFYNLMMFPYPSAEGLHVGNMYAFTGSDIFGRFQRMRGFDVFEPIGLDGFGIHSENYALKIRKHPANQAKISENNFYRQLGMIGNGFAWEERLETYDSAYYRWTQWIFTEMFRRGLAYRKKQAVNWCPSCKTVLADEQAVSGECERCGTRVAKKDLEQWFFRITEYAPRLLKNLAAIDWSERIKIAQRNWIGRSEGALIKFPISNSQFSIEVFTTRPDTLFGATYMVLAPEHPLIEQLAVRVKNLAAVRRYVKQAKAKKTDERIAEGKAKTGVELKGIGAINPANGKAIPVWTADYVLGNVGTGAIMAVPAHDQRDFAFANKFKLPIQEVVLQQFGHKKESAVFRDSVAAVITRSSDDKILVLFNRKSGEYEIPGGGRDGDEEESTTLNREIREETGYVDFQIKEYLGQIATNFFAVGRKEERAKHQKAYHVALLSGHSIPLEPDAHEDFEPHWMKPRDAIKKLDSNIHGCYESEFIKRFLNRRLICFPGEGELIKSAEFTGMSSEQSKWTITKAVGGNRTVTYRLRDWLISRQRYWGPPIPMIYCPACAEERRGERKDMPGWYAVPEKDLPVKLPRIKNFRPTGTEKSPLATVKTFWKVRCPKCKSWARRETDVSDTFLDSAWYYLRYPSTRSARLGQVPWDPAITKKWFPVDMYIGGAEHAVLHLLYVRFLAMAFHDWGMTRFEEPFKVFRAHGLLIKDGAKMSKSKGNVVNPDDYVRIYGADALRMYLMFLGPFEQGGDFRDTGIRGITRFLERVWRLAKNQRINIKNGGSGDTIEVDRLLHRTIQKVTADIEGLQYNTAISGLMVLLNTLEEQREVVTPEHLLVFLRLLAPFAPHLTEELWHTALGERSSIHRDKWPEAESRFLRQEQATVVVQVNGRVRDRIEVATGTAAAAVRRTVLARPRVRERVGGRRVKRFIYVPSKIVNVVV